MLLICTFFIIFQVTIGQRRGISATDAKQMNLLYKAQCSGGGTGGGNGGGTEQLPLKTICKTCITGQRRDCGDGDDH